MKSLINLVQQIQAALKLIDLKEFVRLVGLFNIAGTTDNHVHTKLLKNASLGSEGHKVG